MLIGERLRVLRGEKKLSQGGIEGRTGLRTSYISRVENGHTVPALETLEKMACALEMPLYRLMYDGDDPPQQRNGAGKHEWGSRGKDARYLNKLCQCLSRMSEGDRELLMHFVQDVIKRK